MPYNELSMGCQNQDLDDDLDSVEQASSAYDSDDVVETRVSIRQCSLVALLVAVVSLTAFHMQNRIGAATAAIRHSSAGVFQSRDEGHISARELFESREFADVATENAFGMAARSNQTLDRQAVHVSMVGSLHRVKDMLKHAVPQEYSRLDEIVLTRYQQQAVLGAMRRVTDPQVQQLGKEVVATLGRSVDRPGEDPGNARHRLLQYLRAKHEKIHRLREDIFATLPRPQDENFRPSDVSANLTSSGVLLLDPRRMHIIQQVDHWDMSMEATWPKARRLQEQDLGTVHQAGWFFHLIQGFADRVGLDMKKIKKALEKVDFGELLTCVLSKLAALRFQELAGCASQLAAVAMEVFQLFSSSMKGPASTSSVQQGSAATLNQ